jgi:HlyD family secretion protein
MSSDGAPAPEPSGERRVPTKEKSEEVAAPPRKRRSRVWPVVRRLIAGLVVLALLAGFAGTLYFLYKRSKGDPPVVKTEKPSITDITKKAVATGSIVPRKEVQIKPRVSGILKKLYVVAGQTIKEGDLIADVKIIPDVVAVTHAEGQVRSSDIAAKHAESELRRAQKLSEEGVLSARDLEDKQLDYDIKREEVAAANENLQVVREGAIAKSDSAANTKIVATVSGTVLDVPVEEGSSVIEANNFNEGTTVASVADMSDMIFLGKVDEADVGKIKPGLEVSIQIGAIENRSFDATLEYIATKGKLVDGAIQFEVKAALKPVKDVIIRAGYSANAGIVLEKKTGVLAVNEKLVQFEGEKPFVEVKTGPNKFERRDLEVGISDGIKIEVKSGVDEDSEIKAPNLDPTAQK